MKLNAVIDLSHHNTVSAFWDIKRSGVLGVIHKATQGPRMVDLEYAGRKTRALTTGLLWGAYHFGTNADGLRQAKHFLSKTKSDDTLLVLDWEGNAGDTMTRAQAEQFVQHVFAETGKYPVLYSGQSFLLSQMRGVTNSPLYKCPLWIARYSVFSPKIPKGFSGWDLWQYTSTGKCPGVNGNVDRNKFNGDKAELRAWWAG